MKLGKGGGVSFSFVYYFMSHMVMAKTGVRQRKTPPPNTKIKGGGIIISAQQALSVKAPSEIYTSN